MEEELLHHDIDSALSDFTILVYLSTSSGKNNVDVSSVFDTLQSNVNRKKIAVTTADGKTQCYVEIEKWDHANKKAWLWVKVPLIASDANTDLYLYYDGIDADNIDYVGDPSDAITHKVRDAHFKLVTHMQDDPDTSHIRDSTVNANNGAKRAANEPIEAEGQIAKAQDFDGVDDYIVISAPADGSLDPKHITMEMRIKFDVMPYTDQIALNKEGKYRFFAFDVDAEHLSIRYATTEKTWTYGTFVGNTLLNARVWYHAAAACNGSGWRLYLNGEPDGTKTEDGDLISKANDLYIGALGANNYEFDGIIDEVRISDIARSPAWIKAGYKSEKDELMTLQLQEKE